MADRYERFKWWLADRINRLPGQCWTDLVTWAMHDYRDDPDWRSEIPWRPIGESCRKDAASNGRCYCGKLGSDGTVLRYRESVCVTRMPGRPNDRLCSRPDGHTGMHRCGGVEWARVDCWNAGCDVSAMSQKALDDHIARDHP